MFTEGKISILVPNLLSWDGKGLVTGGVERYVWQLIDLAREMGFVVDVHQNGDSDWQREVNGIVIRGYGLATISTEAALQEMHYCTEKVLYASILLNPAAYKSGSVVISHGVWWDSEGSTGDYISDMFHVCGKALQEAELVVSCDYNFLNVIRAVQPLLAQKIEVIPNFVDVNVFSPAPERDGDTVSILFPRRLDYCRGVDLFLQTGLEILAACPNVSLHLAVDRNYPHLNSQLERWLQQQEQRERIVYGSYSFERMPEVYRSADIVVIPTRFSEGTSFSCLEALASGCAVVSTDVGGLTNLIIDEYNGLLIPPAVEALKKALSRLISEPGLRQRLAKQARSTALAFSHRKWRSRWAEILTRIYGGRSCK
ncbi:MAG: glycosyltransferase family 4 protein [Bacillota bacterium]